MLDSPPYERSSLIERPFPKNKAERQVSNFLLRECLYTFIYTLRVSVLCTAPEGPGVVPFRESIENTLTAPSGGPVARMRGGSVRRDLIKKRWRNENERRVGRGRLLLPQRVQVKKAFTPPATGSGEVAVFCMTIAYELLRGKVGPCQNHRAGKRSGRWWLQSSQGRTYAALSSCPGPRCQRSCSTGRPLREKRRVGPPVVSGKGNPPASAPGTNRRALRTPKSRCAL